MAKKKTYPVLPNSVYVWRGFMAPPPQTYARFAGFLGSVFVPACALLQPTVGLRAYIPTMVPQANKPAAVPDQTALMFWAPPQSHDLANEAIAVRIYQNLHGDAYDMTRSHLPEVPTALPVSSDAFVVEQPYFLFANAADWMLGTTRHVVGAKPGSMSQADFQTAVFQWAVDFQRKPAAGADAALLCCGNGYAVAWVHAPKVTVDFDKALDDFAALTEVQLQITPRSHALKAGLWDNWAGLDLTLPKNTSLNVRFERHADTTPKPPKSQ
ncbi:MAG: hypothetical protein MUE30_16065 [Spirosomaceae bacterium]|nr:hypothetical protein [Spirosomataceae bacterium]